MKIFAVGDLHNHKSIEQKILKELEKGNYELFIGLGDYTEKKYFENLMKKIKIQKICLTGNWDFNFETPENNEVPHLFNYVKANLKASDGEYKIVLLGSGIPSNFAKEVKEWVGDFDPKKLIICSHHPPYLLRDLADNGNHTGIKEFRDLLIRLKPALWLCGHIHEAYGISKFLRTTVVNASACNVNYEPMRAGYSIEITDKGVKIKEVKLS